MGSILWVKVVSTESMHDLPPSVADEVDLADGKALQLLISLCDARSRVYLAVILLMLGSCLLGVLDVKRKSWTNKTIQA